MPVDGEIGLSPRNHSLAEHSVTVRNKPKIKKKNVNEKVLDREAACIDLAKK
jgi:hypothetical protein